MVKCLKIWGCHWKTSNFESKSFKIKTKWFDRISEFSGYSYKFNGNWYVLWKDEENLVLQTKDNKFIIGENNKCELTEATNGERLFTVEENGQNLLAVKYKRKPTVLDPTYDMMDEEMGDFFFWVYRIWNDESWSNALITRYS